MSDVLQQYEARFGMVSPPCDYGHQCFTTEQLAALARAALQTGEPIPWDNLLAPLPPGALS